MRVKQSLNSNATAPSNRWRNASATAAGDHELEKMIREQFRLEMEAIDNAEKDNYVDTRMQMFDSAMGFANDLKGVYNSIQDLVRANMEAELLRAEERGASEEELAQIEAQHAEREKRMAITNVLLQQGQAIASAIAGADRPQLQLPACSICVARLHCDGSWQYHCGICSGQEHYESSQGTDTEQCIDK